MESSVKENLPKRLHLSSLEEKLLSIMPKTKVEGLKGGLDTGPSKRGQEEEREKESQKKRPCVESTPVQASCSTSKSNNEVLVDASTSKDNT